MDFRDFRDLFEAEGAGLVSEQRSVGLVWDCVKDIALRIFICFNQSRGHVGVGVDYLLFPPAFIAARLPIPFRTGTGIPLKTL